MNKIIEKIKEEDIKMKPKWHFVLKTVLVILLGIVSFLMALFFSSFILFSFRPFPWILFLLSIVFIIVLESTLREFKIVYKKPIIYSLLIIIIVLFATGMFLNKTRFHEKVERRNLPGIRKIYKRKMIKNPGIEIKVRRPL